MSNFNKSLNSWASHTWRVWSFHCKGSTQVSSWVYTHISCEPAIWRFKPTIQTNGLEVVRWIHRFFKSSMWTTQLRILRTKLREFATSFESVWTAKKESSGVEDYRGDCSNSLGISSLNMFCLQCGVAILGAWNLNFRQTTQHKQREELKQTFQQKQFIEQNRKSWQKRDRPDDGYVESCSNQV